MLYTCIAYFVFALNLPISSRSVPIAGLDSIKLRRTYDTNLLVDKILSTFVRSSHNLFAIKDRCCRYAACFRRPG